MLKLPDRSAAELEARFGAAPAEAVLAVALERCAGRIALVSSFGAEAAVLLHMVSRIDATVPVLMLDTELLFAETLAYQVELTALFGLADVRRIQPEGATPDLHLKDTEACCAERKVAPMARALEGFAGVITGRKRFQTRERRAMATFEEAEGRLRVNPLANWTAAQIAAYFTAHELPRHPLVARGFPSIGCAPCTSPVPDGGDARSGRWRDEAREECGIHFAPDGTLQRRSG